MRILAVGAHFDDIELGCGGAIARHARSGDDVFMYVATDSGYSNHEGSIIRSAEAAREEGERAAEILGAKELICGDFKTNDLTAGDGLITSLLRVIEPNNIDLMYTHWHGDVHLDHRTLSRASISAGRHISRLLMYRSNTYAGPEPFNGNHFCDISDTFDIKLQAVGVFKSAFGEDEASCVAVLTDEARSAGRNIGAPFAERFEAVKYQY